ncbi:MAG: ABC-2 family transporter protein [bacterium]|nr:ABC-2 family transporter protein [bacterium]
MRKYLQIAKSTIVGYFVYRLNFLLWRLRSFLVQFLALFFFWSAIFGGRTEMFGYQKAQMFTYIIGVTFLRSLVLGSRSQSLAQQIRSGELNNLLVRPVGIRSFWLAMDAGDKFLNLLFTTVEALLALALFKFPLYFPKNPASYLVLIGFLIMAVLLYFFFSFTLSVIAFWTEETWATRFLIGVVLVEAFSGVYFPIDVLPVWSQNLVKMTPFPYLIFFPIKIWLEQLSPAALIHGTAVTASWLGIFFFGSWWLWQKGVKDYGAYGG